MTPQTDTVIDAHTHFFIPGFHEEIRKSMDAGGCSHINILSVSRGSSGTLNDEALGYKKMDPDRIYCFGALDYRERPDRPSDGIPIAANGSILDKEGVGRLDIPSMSAPNRKALAKRLAEQPARLKSLGFDGVKLLESAGGMRRIFKVPMDDELYTPFFAAAERERMPLTWHVGDSPDRWDKATMAEQEAAGKRVYNQPGDKPLDSFRAEAENVLRRHPDLIVIFAHYHFLGGDLPRARLLLRTFRNVCLDVTPGGWNYRCFNDAWEDARAFHIEFQDRLIFGTDLGLNAMRKALTTREWPLQGVANSWKTMREYFAADTLSGEGPAKSLRPGERLRPLNLPGPVTAKLLRENFQRVVGKTPVKPI